MSITLILLLHPIVGILMMYLMAKMFKSKNLTIEEFVEGGGFVIGAVSGWLAIPLGLAGILTAVIAELSTRLYERIKHLKI